MEDEPLSEDQLTRARIWQMMLDSVGTYHVAEKPWAPMANPNKGQYERPLVRDPNQRHPFSKFNI